MTKIRERSGEVDDKRRLVAFLYVLLRDRIPCGEVEEMVGKLEEVEEGEEVLHQFSNGWLATYAQDLADRLTPRGDDENS